MLNKIHYPYFCHFIILVSFFAFFAWTEEFLEEPKERITWLFNRARNSLFLALDGGFLAALCILRLLLEVYFQRVVLMLFCFVGAS